VWIFPPRQLGRRTSHLAVLSATAESDERRTVYTLRVEVEEGRGGRPQPREFFQEEGTAPRESVLGVIAGVLRRIEATPEEPEEIEISGDPGRWEALCGVAAGSPSLDAPRGEDAEAPAAGTDSRE
jgi:hypothetical protein